MQGLHVRIGKERKGRLGLPGEPWGGLEWNYQFNGWSTARQWQTVDVKWGLSDFKRGRKVPQRVSSPRELTPPSFLWQHPKPKYSFLPNPLIVLVKTQRFLRIIFSKHLTHLQITKSVSLLLNCCGIVRGQRKNMSFWMMTCDGYWGKTQNKDRVDFINVPELPESWVSTFLKQWEK